jgi:hypothetical protein
MHQIIGRMDLTREFPNERTIPQVKALTTKGPFSTSEAVQAGLLSGSTYKRHVLDSIFNGEKGGSEQNKLMVRPFLSCPFHSSSYGCGAQGFYHYWKVVDKLIAKSDQDVFDVGGQWKRTCGSCFKLLTAIMS